MLSETSNRSRLVKCLMPGVKVYLNEEPGVVDPFNSADLFRGDECFDGSLRGWMRWRKPSPEPMADAKLKTIVVDSLKKQAPFLCALHDRLLMKIYEKVPSSNSIVFISILRAGVFVALGLAKRMVYHGRDGAPVAAIGLFNEAGFDYRALSEVLNDYPGHFPVFVDGWTGRGVVARELKKAYDEWRKESTAKGLPEKPLLATLVDPGRHGDLYGTARDTPVPCAHFTAPEVFGFSRAFIKNPQEMWAAYRYPVKYYAPELVKAWLNIFKAEHLPHVMEEESPQILTDLLNETAGLTDTSPDQWKVNLNEAVRSFVNRNPRELILGVSVEEAAQLIPDLVYLARRAAIPVNYRPDWGKRHNCLAAVRVM